jgi:hypothetical protein
MTCHAGGCPVKQSTLVRLFGLAALLSLAGCGSRDVVTGRAGLKEMARTELHFGLSMPDGKTVSDAQWQAFVDEHIVPKFKDGLTLLDASGRRVGKDKKVVKESVKIVILIHPDTPRSRIDVFNIISAYRMRFRQAPVVRVTSNVGASF